MSTRWGNEIMIRKHIDEQTMSIIGKLLHGAMAMKNIAIRCGVSTSTVRKVNTDLGKIRRYVGGERNRWTVNGIIVEADNE